MDTSEEINEESDNGLIDECIGYYTRSKRRKLAKDGEKFTISHHSERKRKNPIMYMPTEVLQAVFKYISHQELSENVRRVNHRFKIIAEGILNCNFKRIEKRLTTLILTTEISLQSTEDDMEIKCIAKLLNMLEIIKLQYSLVISTVWRYVYNHYYRTPRTCIYAGQLIDAHFNFLEKFLHCPDQLYSSAIMKDYSLPPEVTKIIQMTKSFCVHFDKVIEEAMPNCLIFSGCKIIDIVDSAKYTQKSVISENACDNVFTAEYSYRFRNSWFIALPVALTKDMSWSQRQRMMHMRLRRIVLAHNDMFLQQDQYEREVMLRPHAVISRTKKPGNNVYTGYGDVGNIFFYYGVMNDGAYAQKFSQEDDQDEDEDDEDFPAQDLPVQEVIPRNNSDEDIFYRIPHLGFRMHIFVQTPLSHAPLNFLKTFDENKFKNSMHNDDSHGPTHIKVIFECDGSAYPRLPARYEYNVKPKHK